MFRWPYPEDVRPDSILYSALMHVLGEAGRVDDVLRWVSSHSNGLPHAVVSATQFICEHESVEHSLGEAAYTSSCSVSSAQHVAPFCDCGRRWQMLGV